MNCLPKLTKKCLNSFFLCDQNLKEYIFTAVIRTDVESTMLNNLCPKNLCNKTFRFMNVTMRQIAYSQIQGLSIEMQILILLVLWLGSSKSS